jgi:hypothetical protein
MHPRPSARGGLDRQVRPILCNRELQIGYEGELANPGKPLSRLPRRVTAGAGAAPVLKPPSRRSLFLRRVDGLSCALALDRATARACKRRAVDDDPLTFCRSARLSGAGQKAAVTVVSIVRA